jgi:hypothetical protein
VGWSCRFYFSCGKAGRVVPEENIARNAYKKIPDGTCEGGHTYRLVARNISQ